MWHPALVLTLSLLVAPPQYHVAEVPMPEGTVAIRPLCIGTEAQVVGQADIVEKLPPLRPRSLADGRQRAYTDSYFDADAPYSHGGDLDALGLVFLLFNPRRIGDFYSGKLEKEAESRLPTFARSGRKERKIYQKAFVSIGGKTITFDTFGGDGGVATAVNGLGQVVGLAQTSLYDPQFHHAFLFTPEPSASRKSANPIIDLGTLGGQNSAAYAISDTGIIVGDADTKNNVVRAFRYPPGGAMQDLGTLGGSQSYARGVNKRGQVVGWSENAQYETRAFIWQDGAMRPLGIPNGAKATYAVAVNDAGLIAGRMDTSNGSARAVLWDSAGNATVLESLGGPSSEAMAVNATGLIVGASDAVTNAGKPEKHAVLWQDGKIYDLNSLLPPHSEWTLESATGINDRGEIVGSGRHRGKQRAFRLTP